MLTIIIIDIIDITPSSILPLFPLSIPCESHINHSKCISRNSPSDSYDDNNHMLLSFPVYRGSWKQTPFALVTR